MQQLIGQFIQALRLQGIAAGPAESLDAMQAASLVGVGNRQQLKQVLKATLVKQQSQSAVYDVVFEQFFASALSDSLETQSSPQTKQVTEENSQQVAELVAQQTEAAESALGSSDLALLMLNGDSADMAVAVAQAASQAGAENMQVFTQKAMVSQRVMQRLGDGALRDLLLQLNENGNADELVEQLEQQRAAVRQQVNQYLEQQFLLYGKGRGKALQQQSLKQLNLAQLDHNQQKEMTKLVRKVAKKLASQHSRRRKMKQRGVLDIRKTLAANAGYDGLLFQQRWKERRIDRPKIVVFCDVSGSVSQVSGFLLMFLYSLQEVLPRVRSYVFTSNLHDVTEQLENLPIEEALSYIQQHYANGSTDYAIAMRDIERMALDKVDHKTTVIMMGDARNNQGSPQSDVWQKVYRQAKRVLWLNPENKMRWNSGDSVMSAYTPFCSQAEACNTLNDLERIVSRTLR